MTTLAEPAVELSPLDEARAAAEEVAGRLVELRERQAEKSARLDALRAGLAVLEDEDAKARRDAAAGVASERLAERLRLRVTEENVWRLRERVDALEARLAQAAEPTPEEDR